MTKKTRKKMRKALLMFCCAALLVCLTVGVTVAYLTDKDEVKNTFTVGKVDITLTETAVDENGDPIPSAEPTTANEYHLLPGLEYTKDPTVTVMAESENCYVRAIVTITKGNAIHALPASMEIDDCFDIDATNWDYKSEKYDETGDGTYTYEFWYKRVVPASDADQKLEPLFTKITMPGEMTNEQLTNLEGMEINVVAHAIQADGFDDADAAWAAWKN